MLSPTDVAGVGVPAYLHLGKMLVNTSKAFYSATAYSPPKEDAHLSKANAFRWENTGVGKVLMGRLLFWIQDGLLAPYPIF